MLDPRAWSSHPREREHTGEWQIFAVTFVIMFLLRCSSSELTFAVISCLCKLLLRSIISGCIVSSGIYLPNALS